MSAEIIRALEIVDPEGDTLLVSQNGDYWRFEVKCDCNVCVDVSLHDVETLRRWLTPGPG